MSGNENGENNAALANLRRLKEEMAKTRSIVGMPPPAPSFQSKFMNALEKRHQQGFGQSEPSNIYSERSEQISLAGSRSDSQTSQPKFTFKSAASLRVKKDRARDEELQAALAAVPRENDLNNIYTVCNIRKEYDLLASHSLMKDPKFVDYTFVKDLQEWEAPKGHDHHVKRILKETFKLNTFRMIQKPVINAVLEKRDVFCCMPTGGGKSLVYQVSAVQFGKITLVVMPLISLIQDQMQKLKALNIDYLSNQGSEMESKEIYTKLKDYIKNPDSCPTTILFMTPEKYSQSSGFVSLLQQAYSQGLIKLIVIDEAHCLSNWGHEFREDYLKLKGLRPMFPGVPILALTATATKMVREDVMKILQMKRALYFQSGFNRTNLRYSVVKKAAQKDKGYYQLVDMLKRYPGMSGIIYCITTSETTDLANRLNSENCLSRFQCLPYHGQMEKPKREDNMRQWMAGRVNVIVATIAFGMGVDKPNVRFVVHYALSRSVENYYQESGRAGRDGLISDCILMYSSRDVSTHEYLLSVSEMNERALDRGKYQLSQMQRYAEDESICRRQFQLLYFGQEFDPQDCNKHCDNCFRESKIERRDYCEHLYKVLDEFSQMPGLDRYSNITPTILIRFLRGNLKDIGDIAEELPQGLNGLMSDMTEKETTTFVDSLIRNSYLKCFTRKNPDNFIYTTLGYDKEKHEIIKRRQTDSKSGKKVYYILPETKNSAEDIPFERLEEALHKQQRRNSVEPKRQVSPIQKFAKKSEEEEFDSEFLSSQKEVQKPAPVIPEPAQKVGSSRKLTAERQGPSANSQSLKDFFPISEKKRPEAMKEWSYETGYFCNEVMVENTCQRFRILSLDMSIVLGATGANIEEYTIPNKVYTVLALYLPTSRKEYDQISEAIQDPAFDKLQKYLFEEVRHVLSVYQIDKRDYTNLPKTADELLGYQADVDPLHAFLDLKDELPAPEVPRDVLQQLHRRSDLAEIQQYEALEPEPLSLSQFGREVGKQKQ